MKYIFRGHIIFEYDPEKQMVKQNKIDNIIPAFDYCIYDTESYKLLSLFFKRVAAHREGELKTEDLKDIEVY